MRALAAAAALAAMLTLTACMPSGPATEKTNDARPEVVTPFEVNLEDGRIVLCVFAKSSYGGGLSCDWAGAQ